MLRSALLHSLLRNRYLLVTLVTSSAAGRKIKAAGGQICSATVAREIGSFAGEEKSVALHC